MFFNILQAFLLERYVSLSLAFSSYFHTSKKQDDKFPRSFNFSFTYIDDVFIIYNPNLFDWVQLIYPQNQKFTIQQARLRRPNLSTYAYNLTYTVFSVPESITNETNSILKLSISASQQLFTSFTCIWNKHFSTYQVFKRVK